MSDAEREREGLEWQTRVWDRMSDVYLREIDRRFAPAVEALLGRAELVAGERVLDLGTGTGAVAKRAAELVGPSGGVLGVDLSPEMLTLARESAGKLGLGNLRFAEGRAEAIPADEATFDVVCAGLSMMFVVERQAGAHEIARVLKPGGRFVASVWAGPEQSDLVRLQQLAGSFAGPPPVSGVGPGALADPRSFLRQLEAAGITAHVETETVGFDLPDFTTAWDTFAAVTAARLSPDRLQQAKQAVLAELYPQGDGPRHFRNVLQLIVGRAHRGA